MGAAEKVTLEQLERKAEALRPTSPPVAESSGPTTGEPGPITRQCSRCSGDFEAMPLSLMGRVMYPQKVCGPCIEKGREEERRLDALQRQHVSKLEGQDRELTLRKLLHDLGANPWEHGHASLDNFDPGDSPKALGAAREFANAVKAAGKYDPVRGLYLWGETGPGKTHLAVGVVRWLLEEDYRGDIVFDHAASLIARIQDTYGRKDERTMSVLEKRVHAGLWILDDFGTERPSDDVIRHMTVIFAERAMRPTLVTSNYSPERMDRDRPDMMRVLSRLGPKYFRTVEVKGRDRRFD
jgi:DNA replication protein DnaC